MFIYIVIPTFVVCDYSHAHKHRYTYIRSTSTRILTDIVMYTFALFSLVDIYITPVEYLVIHLYTTRAIHEAVLSHTFIHYTCNTQSST
jgi:hypothetical protein